MQLLHESLHPKILIALQCSHFTDGETILREVKPHGPADTAARNGAVSWFPANCITWKNLLQLSLSLQSISALREIYIK